MKEKLAELVADTPMQYRKYVDLGIVETASDWQAKKAGKSEVDEDSLVRGFIVAIPRHLRDGIHETLTEHNYDLLYFRPVFDEPNFLPDQHKNTHRPLPPTA